MRAISRWIRFLATALGAATVTMLGSQELEALRAIDARALVATKAIAQRSVTLPEGRERRELQRRVVEIKRETELERLRTMLDFARRRGDAARATQVERAIQNFAPRPKPAVPAGQPELKPQRSP